MRVPGLVSDVEVIDDYPSHYSAYNRRKHRWVRGDWQIVSGWAGRVPRRSWTARAQPYFVLSRWKILDNLRRSLVLGRGSFCCLSWDGPCCRAGRCTGTCHHRDSVRASLVPVRIFGGAIAGWQDRLRPIRRCAGRTGHVDGQWVSDPYLPRPSDADLGRRGASAPSYRRMVSRQRLLEWETAAEAEADTGKRRIRRCPAQLDPAVALIVGIVGLRLPPACTAF